MSRDIKFRVWDNKYKSWMQCGFSFNGVGDFISRGGRGFAFQTILDNETLTDKIHEEIPFNGTNPRWIVQQFTGAKDKNSKEIYEGDIVKVKRSFIKPFINNNQIDYEHVESDEEVGYIIWGWNSYKWLVSYEHIRYDDFDDFNGLDHRHEVIGNIFEKKELLK